MAIIVCPKCGKRISFLAAGYLSCGYPLATASESGCVTIRIPKWIPSIWQEWPGKFRVFMEGPEMCWVGDLGDTARFRIDKSTVVSVRLVQSIDLLKAEIYPNASYTLECVGSQLFLLPDALVGE